jgi:NAD+ diphosphatase
MTEPNTFAGARIDRAGPQRSDPAWVADRLADPASRALVVTRDGVFLEGADDASAPSDLGSWDAAPGAPLRPALVGLAALAELAGAVAPVLLGVGDDDAAVWAVDADAVPGEALATAVAPAGLAGVRDAAARLDPGDAGLVAYASAMLGWHRRHGFCANCGAASVAGEAGHVRTCPSCGASHHPRTDPVVIMLVVDEAEDRVLLGRQPSWPRGRYSALAGFVEPGESLEAAVAREVLEEAGVAVTGTRYESSQPWPFPGSLMLGFTTRYAGGEPRAVDGELDDVRWFSREELASPDGGLALPPPVAIARRLIDGWLR